MAVLHQICLGVLLQHFSLRPSLREKKRQFTTKGRGCLSLILDICCKVGFRVYLYGILPQQERGCHSQGPNPQYSVPSTQGLSHPEGINSIYKNEIGKSTPRCRSHEKTRKQNLGQTLNSGQNKANIPQSPGGNTNWYTCAGDSANILTLGVKGNQYVSTLHMVVHIMKCHDFPRLHVHS